MLNHPSPLLWVHLKFRDVRVPAIVDTGSQFSCIRVDVIKYVHLTGHPSFVFSCDINYLLVESTKGHVTNAVKLHFGLLSFSWTQEFKILQNGLFRPY